MVGPLRVWFGKGIRVHCYCISELNLSRERLNSFETNFQKCRPIRVEVHCGWPSRKLAFVSFVWLLWLGYSSGATSAPVLTCVLPALPKEKRRINIWTTTATGSFVMISVSLVTGLLVKSSTSWTNYLHMDLRIGQRWPDVPKPLLKNARTIITSGTWKTQW